MSLTTNEVLEALEKSCLAVQEEMIKLEKPDGVTAAWAILTTVRFVRKIISAEGAGGKVS